MVVVDDECSGFSAPGFWQLPRRGFLPPAAAARGREPPGTSPRDKAAAARRPRREWAERRRQRAEQAVRGEGAGRALLVREIYRLCVAGGALLGCLWGIPACEMAVKIPMNTHSLVDSASLNVYLWRFINVVMGRIFLKPRLL